MAWADVYMARFAFRKFIDRIVALGVRGQDLEHLANVVLEKLDAVESQLIAASTAAAKRAKGAQAAKGAKAAARRLIDDIRARQILEEERARQFHGHAAGNGEVICYRFADSGPFGPN